jgi:hypothetical protein
MPGIRKQARQIARKAVERQKAVAKNLKRHDDPRAKAAGKRAMSEVREKKKEVKGNYIATRKAIKKLYKNTPKKK